MIKPTNRKKRNSLKVVLLAPIFVIFFIAGWSLYWIGQSWQQNTKQPKKPLNSTPTNQNEVELIMIPQQEEQILPQT